MRLPSLVAALASLLPLAAAAADGPIPATAAPLSLTASDGTGLLLEELTAGAVLQAPLAFTELHLTFVNPQDRVIEGQFAITLPPGATVARFAMKLGDRWQEGEVVEKQAARRAYEDFLHKRQDPALLEQGGGNEFTARVFPIPARGRKELILSYGQELPRSDEPFVLPLRGLPRLGKLEVRVLGGAAGPVVVSHGNWVPDRDVTVPQPPGGNRGLRSGELLVARVTPLAVSQPDELGSLLVLVDTSASRTLGFAAQQKLLQRLLEGIAAKSPALPLTVAAFDQEAVRIFEGEARSFGAKELKQLRDRRALGASDLVGALAFARAELRRSPRKRLLLIGDGIATAGELGPEALRGAVRALGAGKLERLDAIAVGGLRDEGALRGLVTAGLPRDGALLDGGLAPELLLRRLSEGTRSGLQVAVQGASWVWPRRLDGIQAGDQALIYAELPPGAPVALKIDGKPVAVEAVSDVERPLLARASAQAQIARLLASEESGGAAAKAETKQQIVGLSIRHRVLSPYTALLVLETEADYERFGIARNALSDLLTVNAQGLAVVRRSAADLPPPPQPQARQDPRPPEKKKSKDENKADRSGLKGGADQGDRDGARDEAPEPPRPSDAPGANDDAGATTTAERVQAKPSAEPAPGPPPPAAAAVAPPASPAPSRRAEAPAEELEEEEASKSVAAGPSGRASGSSGLASRPRPSPRRPPPTQRPPPRHERPQAATARPYDGPFAEVMELLSRRELQRARARATSWTEEHPGDVMALVSLGEVFEAARDRQGAARAYGSLIDLFPGRADLRRFAGERLERLGDAGSALAIDTYRKAVEERPDHPASHRLLAFALLRAGRPAEAFEVLLVAVTRSYPDGRFRGVLEILREDLGLAAAAWIKAEPGKRAEILKRLTGANGVVEDKPSLRFVLVWETDANDVDFHIYDAKGGHAYYSQPQLHSGGRLYADVTTGYGPECFTIRKPRGARAYPYTLQAHYYSRGPMGYGMGKLQIVEHDGKGGLALEERPFVVMKDGAFLDLGKVTR